MIRSFSALIALVLLGGALAHAQEPPRLVVPNLRGIHPEDANRPDTGRNMVDIYATHREAALAAFQAGYKSATAKEPRLERAMGLFLLSLRRDPTLAKALFNLGILCAQSSRWSDAISFQSEFQMQPAVDPAWLKSSASEAERLKTIMRLEGTAEGKLRRRFDTELWPVLEMTDPIKALNEVGRLTRLDKNRWEAPALAGILHAENKAYSESAGALDEAARLAEAVRLPPQRTANLKLAAEMARREAAFAGQVREAGIFWEKQQYDTAAKGYQAAWQAIPRASTGMQAATAYLMADQVAPAVEILSGMRESAPPEMAARISAMLHELGAIPEGANAPAGRIQPASQSAPTGEPVAQIRTLVGPLASPEVELVVRPAPPLLSDTSYVTPIPDEEVTGPRSDTAFISTVSIFAMYQRDLARSAPRPESLPAPQPAPVPQTQPVATPLAPLAVQPPPPPEPTRNNAPGGPAILPPVRGRPGASSKGQEQPVPFLSTPVGAAFLVDGDPALRCLAPCELRLAPGRHSLLVTLVGHHDEPRIFNVDKGKPLTMDVALRAKMGYVKVETETPGVAIYVNGKAAGKVTPAQLPLAEGQYEVGVEIEGQMRTAKVSVMYEQVTTIKW
jgi:tetratricopeptide (TPR) repeat protein